MFNIEMYSYVIWSEISPKYLVIETLLSKF